MGGRFPITLHIEFQGAIDCSFIGNQVPVILSNKINNVTVLHCSKHERMKMGYHVLTEMTQFSKHLLYFNIVVSAIPLQ